MARSGVAILIFFPWRLTEFVGLAFFIVDGIVARARHLLNIFVYDFRSLTTGTDLVCNHSFFHLTVVLVVLSRAWVLAIFFFLSTLNSEGYNIFSEVIIISIVSRARY